MGGRPSVGRGGLTAALAAVALLGGAGMASAQAGTLSLTLSASTIRDGASVNVAARGTFTQWSELEVDVQESSDACAATSAAEDHRVQDHVDRFDANVIQTELGNPDLFPGAPASDPSPGTYSVLVGFSPTGAGPYRFCGYLLVAPGHPGADPTGTPQATSTALLRISRKPVPHRPAQPRRRHKRPKPKRPKRHSG